MNELDSLNALKENYLIKIGSTWLSDDIALYLLTPIGTTSVLLNFLCLLAFLKTNNHSNLTEYFRFYTLTSFIGCLLALLYFTTAARYFDYDNSSWSYWISLYRCILSQYIVTIHFYVNSLSCLILFERLSYFKQKLKAILSKIRPCKLCLISFFVCNLINLPSLFFFSMRTNEELKEAMNDFNLTVKEFTYCKRNPFYQTIYGQLILFIVVLLRDILMLIMEFSISFVSIKYFKDYLGKKRNLIQTYVSSTPSTNNLKDYIIDITRANLNKSENFNSNLTKMTIYLIGCSITLHLTLVICYLIVFIFFNQNSLASNYVSLLCLMMAFVKYILNFVFFYRFYRFFRQFLKKIFTKSIHFIFWFYFE